jgi:chaperonin cofactor prefoldin
MKKEDKASLKLEMGDAFYHRTPNYSYLAIDRLIKLIEDLEARVKTLEDTIKQPNNSVLNEFCK